MAGDQRRGYDHPHHEDDTDGPATTPAAARLFHQNLGVIARGVVRHRIRDARGTPGQNHNGSTIAIPMLKVNVDRSEAVLLHDQVAAEIRRAIAQGEAKPGERLPLVKDIAAVLGVNRNTVLRAMHILRDEGLLEFSRGRGITVVGAPHKSALVREVRQLVDSARKQGYRREDVIGIIQSLP